MNSLLPIDLASPYGKIERCAKFAIDIPGDVFVLPDVMIPGETYTLSFWACLCEESTSNSKKYVVIDKTSFELTNEWTRFTDTFVASDTMLTWRFTETCECAIFNPKLERGDKATDWTPATEDMASGNDLSAAETALDQKISSVDAKFKILEGSIASLVRRPDGGSLVTQHADGLYFLFDLSGIEQDLNDSGKRLDDIEGLVVSDGKEIDILNSSVEALQKVTEYIRSGVTKDLSSGTSSVLVGSLTLRRVDDGYYELDSYTPKDSRVTVSNIRATATDDFCDVGAEVEFDWASNLATEITLDFEPSSGAYYSTVIGSSNQGRIIMSMGVPSESQGSGEYLYINIYATLVNNITPYIELGDETAFKVLITNTQIKFMDGTTAPAYISNKKLYIERAQVKDELQVGDETDAGIDGIFVWKVRANGNMGLTWRPKELLTEEVVANG